MRTDVNFSDRRVTDKVQAKMHKTEGRKEKRKEERNRMMQRDKTVAKKQLNISVFAP
jgi:hypothetical protein